MRNTFAIESLNDIRWVDDKHDCQIGDIKVSRRADETIGAYLVHACTGSQ